jgi:phosphoribosylanthranilate isomerase
MNELDEITGHPMLRTVSCINCVCAPSTAKDTPAHKAVINRPIMCMEVDCYQNESARRAKRWHGSLAFASAAASAKPALLMSMPAIKVCGVVSPADAQMIVRCVHEELPCSTDLFIGMIIWPGSRRSVSRHLAREIAATATANGAIPVGVFVDETSAAIAEACLDLEIPIAQLHGRKCRQSVLENPLPDFVSAVDVVDVASDGSLVPGTALDEPGGLNPLWRLYDSKGGGSGLAFNWTNFKRPAGDWFLAGGLNPENVADAIRTLRPTGLDVASGVSRKDGRTKDEVRLRAFLQNAWHAVEVPASHDQMNGPSGMSDSAASLLK